VALGPQPVLEPAPAPAAAAPAPAPAASVISLLDSASVRSNDAAVQPPAPAVPVEAAAALEEAIAAEEPQNAAQGHAFELAAAAALLHNMPHVAGSLLDAVRQSGSSGSTRNRSLDQCSVSYPVKRVSRS
jgi:hypothetical protein